MRNRSLRHRPGRTIPAIIVSIVLVALGVALTWVSIFRLVNGAWPVWLARPRASVTDLTWHSVGGWTIAALAAIIGIVLLLTAIIPGRRNAVFVTPNTRSDDAATDTPSPAGEEFILTRKAIARLAVSQADRVDGVSSVSAAATEKRVTLHATTTLQETTRLRDQVVHEVTDRLGAVNLSPTPKVSVTVTTKDS